MKLFDRRLRNLLFMVLVASTPHVVHAETSAADHGAVAELEQRIRDVPEGRRILTVSLDSIGEYDRALDQYSTHTRIDHLEDRLGLSNGRRPYQGGKVEIWTVNDADNNEGAKAPPKLLGRITFLEAEENDDLSLRKLSVTVPNEPLQIDSGGDETRVDKLPPLSNSAGDAQAETMTVAKSLNAKHGAISEVLDWQNGNEVVKLLSDPKVRHVTKRSHLAQRFVATMTKAREPTLAAWHQAAREFYRSLYHILQSQSAQRYQVPNELNNRAYPSRIKTNSWQSGKIYTPKHDSQAIELPAGFGHLPSTTGYDTIDVEAEIGVIVPISADRLLARISEVSAFPQNINAPLTIDEDDLRYLVACHLSGEQLYVLVRSGYFEGRDPAAHREVFAEPRMPANITYNQEAIEAALRTIDPSLAFTDLSAEHANHFVGPLRFAIADAKYDQILPIASMFETEASGASWFGHNNTFLNILARSEWYRRAVSLDGQGDVTNGRLIVKLGQTAVSPNQDAKDYSTKEEIWPLRSSTNKLIDQATVVLPKHMERIHQGRDPVVVGNTLIVSASMLTEHLFPKHQQAGFPGKIDVNIPGLMLSNGAEVIISADVLRPHVYGFPQTLTSYEQISKTPHLKVLHSKDSTR